MKIAQLVGCRIPFSPNLPDTPFSIPAISYLITEELVRRGHEVTVFATSDSRTSAQVAVGLFSSKDKRFQLDRQSKTVKKLYRQHFQNAARQAGKFDIIHSHYNDFLPYAEKIDTPVVTTLHGPTVSKLKNRRSRKAHFIAISRKQIKNNPDLNFAGVVYHGIDVARFTFNNKPKDYLGWLGRITPIKGAREAVATAEILNKKLILAGNIDYDEKEYVREILRKVKNNKKIKYIGEVGHKKKIDFLKNAKVILMPVLWEEPFGLVAIEAMASGTPVVAFRNGALPEIIKNKKTGFLVSTVGQMAEAVLKIDQIKRKNCRELVKKRFNVQKMVDGYERIYKKVIALSIK